MIDSEEIAATNIKIELAIIKQLCIPKIKLDAVLINVPNIATPIRLPSCLLVLNAPEASPVRILSTARMLAIVAQS